jgi:alpha-L-rhamnosidase
VTEAALPWCPVDLRVERQTTPVVPSGSAPRLSFRLPPEAQGVALLSAEVRSAKSPAGLATPSWVGGCAPVGGAPEVRYGGPRLRAGERCYFQVRVATDRGVSAWSPASYFEGGLSPDDWAAVWIRPRTRPPVVVPDRSAWLARRVVDLETRPTWARLYASALGVYQLVVNGEAVGPGVLRPGWTDTARRLQYQVVDVAPLLRAGRNVLGAIVGPGWHAGRITSGPAADNRLFPDLRRSELLVQLEMTLADAADRVVTDELWEWRESPILASDLYDGERWDRRLVAGPSSGSSDPLGWSAGGWHPVEVSCGTAARLVPERAAPVEVVAERTCRRLVRPDGRVLLDSAENDAGFVELVVEVPRGQEIEVVYGEVLEPSGEIHRANLQRAECVDRFVCAGEPGSIPPAGRRPEVGEVLAPLFAFRGFRYAEVRGLPSPDALREARAVTISSVGRRVGWFDCSEELLNALGRAVLCSMRANYLEVPTDCPQRDERLGWMADAALFAPLATYLHDVEAFLAKWLDDVLDARTPYGGFADIAPRPTGRIWFRDEEGAPAWADAGVHVPWTLYQRYGNHEVLERMLPAVVDWLAHVGRSNPDGIWRHRRGNDYGDWVPIGPDTSHELFATAWLAFSTLRAARGAAIVGDDRRARALEEVAAARRAAFVAAYVDADTGRIRDPSVPPGPRAETQTGYVLALCFGLLPGEMREVAGARLAELVTAAGQLETGFSGSAFLLPALEEANRVDLAYDLLLRRDPPSLGFMVEKGATSIWERWDGIGPDGWPAAYGMNSFNHYALGTMWQWAIEGVAGLRPDEEGPAFGRFAFRPAVSRRLDHASFRYDARPGRIEVAWRWIGPDVIAGEVVVPPGTTCEIAREVAVDAGSSRPVARAGATFGAGPVGPGRHRVTWMVGSTGA